MIGIMHLTRSYHWSTGSLVTIVEDGALGNLAAAGDREENASHHFPKLIRDHPRQLGITPEHLW